MGGDTLWHAGIPIWLHNVRGTTDDDNSASRGDDGASHDGTSRSACAKVV